VTQLREIKTNFAAGEVSPEIRARQTGGGEGFYLSGAARLYNCYVRPQGGVFKRPGTRNLEVPLLIEGRRYEAKRVFPFQFSASQTYLVVLLGTGDDSLREEHLSIFRSSATGFIFETRLPVLRSIGGIGNLEQRYWGSLHPDIRTAQLNEVLLFFAVGRPVLRLRRRLTNWTLDIPDFTHSDSDDDGPETGFTQTARLGLASTGGPSCGCFHAGRLWLGGFEASPNLIVGSRAASHFDLDQSEDNDDYAISLLAGSADGVATVRDLLPSRGLYAFTDSGIYQVGPRNTVPTPTNAHLDRMGPETSTCAPAELFGGAVAFVPSGRDSLRLVDYYDERGGFVTQDVSVHAHHLMRGLRRLAFQPTQSSTGTDLIYALREDGALVVGSGRVGLSDFGYAFSEWAIRDYPEDLRPEEVGVPPGSATARLAISDICAVYNGATGETDICAVLSFLGTGARTGFSWVLNFEPELGVDCFSNSSWWRDWRITERDTVGLANGFFGRFVIYSDAGAILGSGETYDAVTGTGNSVGVSIPLYVKLLPTDAVLSGRRGFEWHSAGKKKLVAWSQTKVIDSGSFVYAPKVGRPLALGDVSGPTGSVHTPPGAPDGGYGVYTGQYQQGGILGWNSEAAPAYFTEGPMGFQLVSVVYRVEIARS